MAYLRAKQSRMESAASPLSLYCAASAYSKRCVQCRNRIAPSLLENCRKRVRTLTSCQCLKTDDRLLSGQDALDIFDSVVKLGTGGADGGLHHTKYVLSPFYIGILLSSCPSEYGNCRQLSKYRQICRKSSKSRMICDSLET